MYKRIAEIKAANARASQYFFSKATMKSFGTRVLPTVYGGKYFITEDDNFDATAKVYKIWEAKDNGHVTVVGMLGSRTFLTLQQAKDTVMAILESEK